MAMRTLLSTVALGLLLTLPPAAAGQDLGTQLNGVWALRGVAFNELQTGTMTKPLGEKPVGHLVFTRGGHFVWALVADDRKAPASAVATDAERIALYSTSSFGTGTYRVEGSTVSLRYDTSSNQSWTGTERKAEMQVSGKALTWKSPPFKSMAGKDVISILTWERVE